MKIEPVTQEQVDALARAIGPLSAMIGGLGEVDVSKGRGVLEGLERCLWTRDNRRVTVTPLTHGGLIVSCSKEPDPEAPKA